MNQQLGVSRDEVSAVRVLERRLPDGAAITDHFAEVPGRLSRKESDEHRIHVSRWTGPHKRGHRSQVAAADHHYLIMIAARPVEVEIVTLENVVFQGAMPSGASYVCMPHHTALIEFRSSFDILRLDVSTRFVAENGMRVDSKSMRLSRDPIVEMLTKTLVENAQQPISFALGIAQALAARILREQETSVRGNALAKWRLMKFEKYIESRLHEPVALDDMATAVGLSRMHFAKSFRLATGFTPHEYLLFRRVEWAKNAMLTSRMTICEIALESGFQAQAHFSTIFKRFTGTSPARWKEENGG